MTTIGYNDIENVLLSLTDPNTWWAISNVPWVSSPKINAWTSIYNEQGWGSGIAWWSTNIWWSSTDYNTVRWTSWSIYLPDWTEYTVTSGNTWDMSTMTYIYYDEESGSVLTTTSASASVWEKKILLCVAWPTTSWKDAEFQAFWTNAQSTFIYADNIAANTITASEIASNSIETRHLDSYSVTASKIDSWAITTSKLAVWAVDASAIEDWAVVASKIETWAVTASKIDVSSLSAITANLWDVYVWTSWDSEIRIYTSGSQWRIYFSYEWSTVWYMIWDSIDWVWDTVAITWGSSGSWNIALNGKVWCLNRLRIPVWDNLY